MARRYGRVVHSEVGTSGTRYRVRELLDEPGHYAITVGRAPALVECATLYRSQLPDVSTYVDECDEETRCLLVQAREEFGVR